jgi:hypothetical protein
MAFVLPDDSCSRKPPVGIQVDGPYVLYKSNKAFVKYIYDDLGNKSVYEDVFTIPSEENLKVKVATDDSIRFFTVELKKKVENEKSEFHHPSKMFIVSDIEGNFKAFRKLLQGNGVIDTAFNWTFGDGHLVLTGDFVDRGDQVTEVLWLIYSLEEKAKAAGGHVHYILGNHEIMNMNGDLRYLHPKYISHAALLEEGFTTLYGENAELGRWLRSKNVMEKIGDILFIHGGISSEVNNLELGTGKVNKLARPYYADSSYKYKNVETEILYSDLGPFWYRGYYSGSPKATIAQIDSTLNHYKVKHIATGHTVISDNISSLYGGKVLNTDVHHAKGFSEGLLVEGGKFYRVNETGEKLEIGQ